jgi:hypothetical protein
MRVFSLFIFLSFLFFSCKPSVTEKHQVTRSQLQGNWVCETLLTGPATMACTGTPTVIGIVRS